MPLNGNLLGGMAQGFGQGQQFVQGVQDQQLQREMMDLRLEQFKQEQEEAAARRKKLERALKAHDKVVGLLSGDTAQRGTPTSAPAGSSFTQSNPALVQDPKLRQLVTAMEQRAPGSGLEFATTQGLFQTPKAERELATHELDMQTKRGKFTEQQAKVRVAETQQRMTAQFMQKGASVPRFRVAAEMAAAGEWNQAFKTAYPLLAGASDTQIITMAAKGDPDAAEYMDIVFGRDIAVAQARSGAGTPQPYPREQFLKDMEDGEGLNAAIAGFNDLTALLAESPGSAGFLGAWKRTKVNAEILINNAFSDSPKTADELIKRFDTEAGAAQDIQALLLGSVRALVKATSGAAATDAEARRIMKETGIETSMFTSFTTSAPAIMRGIDLLRKRAEFSKGQIAARPELWQRYAPMREVRPNAYTSKINSVLGRGQPSARRESMQPTPSESLTLGTQSLGDSPRKKAPPANDLDARNKAADDEIERLEQELKSLGVR